MSNWRQQVKNNPHFCVMPFSHMHLTTDGRVNACCMAHFDHPIETNTAGKTFDEIWTSEEYKQLRRDMLDGKRVARCEICYKQDDEGGGSDRQTLNRFFNAPSDEWDIDIDQGNTDGYPTSVDLRPGRFCNLGCRMCFVAISSTVADEHKANPELTDITGESWVEIEEWIDDPDMYRSLQELVPKLKTIKLAGGEPLFMPGVIKLLKWCIESGNTHLHLDITTNGTRTKGKIVSWLEQFSRVDIQYSIDGVGAVNDYIRYPSDWATIDTSYDTYLQMENLGSINILSTVQAYNAFDLTNIVNYWKSKGSHGNMIFNFVNWPQDMNIDIIPLNDRLAIAESLEAALVDLSEDKKQQCRVDAMSYRLRQEFESDHINEMRYKWAKRTLKYDELRNQNINDINTKLAEYVNEWMKIKNQ